MNGLSDLLGAYESTVKRLAPRIVMPVRGARVSQGVTSTHNAIDFAAPLGTPIVAPTRGIVTSVVQDLTTGYGRHVRVTTPAGEELIFGHLSDILVKLGQKISAGMQLGTMGSTGESTGSHLHFERRVAGQAVDPWALLKDAPMPDITGLTTGVTTIQQRPSRPRAPVSTQAVRSIPPSINFGQIEGVAPVTKIEKIPTLPDQLVKALASPFERSVIGAIGVILIVVGLFMFSSGLREKAVDVGILAGKAIAGAAVGGVPGAAVSVAA